MEVGPLTQHIELLPIQNSMLYSNETNSHTVYTRV